MKPRWLRIGGYWYPRGGMPIDVFWQSGAPPEGLWLPDQGVQPYRGRGCSASDRSLRGVRQSSPGTGATAASRRVQA